MKKYTFGLALILIVLVLFYFNKIQFDGKDESSNRGEVLVGVQKEGTVEEPIDFARYRGEIEEYLNHFRTDYISGSLGIERRILTEGSTKGSSIKDGEIVRYAAEVDRGIRYQLTCYDKMKATHYDYSFIGDFIYFSELTEHYSSPVTSHEDFADILYREYEAGIIVGEEYHSFKSENDYGKINLTGGVKEGIVDDNYRPFKTGDDSDIKELAFSSMEELDLLFAQSEPDADGELLAMEDPDDDVWCRTDYPLIDVQLNYNDAPIALIIANGTISGNGEYLYVDDRESLRYMQRRLNVLTFPKAHGTTPGATVYIYENNILIKEIPCIDLYEGDTSLFEILDLAEVERRIQQELPPEI